MLKIYHNPRCKKSCEGLKYLQSKGVPFEIVKYIETGLTIDNLKEILLKSNQKIADFVRKQEAYYKTDLQEKNFTDNEWMKIITEHPKLLQRPIVVGKLKALLAQPAETIDRLL